MTHKHQSETAPHFHHLTSERIKSPQEKTNRRHLGEETRKTTQLRLIKQIVVQQHATIDANRQER